jgi:predicted DNA-binding transcriptional regulator YafY
LLRLLSLLGSRRSWPGDELAQRLGVSPRTVRRDVERLRELGYPVEGTTGAAGGYRLAAGASLPPLLLDDEEAVAVAVGLTTAAASGVAGIEDDSMRALTKLEQVLPARLRPQLAAFAGATAALARPETPGVDPSTLAVLASCCRHQEIVTFDYEARDGKRRARRVEPHNLVSFRGFWYLVAHDPQRADWRTFRVDRMDSPTSTRHRFTRRQLPAPDAATYLARSFAAATYRHTATLTVRLPAAAVRANLFGPVPGEIEELGPDTCAVRLSADSPELLLQYVARIAALGTDVTIEASDEITRRLNDLARIFATTHRTPT